MSLSLPTFLSIDFERLLNNDRNNDPASFNINFPLPESRYIHYIIKGSCRGFIFMYHDVNFYLWNPCTGFKKQIPLSPFASKLGADRYNLNLDAYPWNMCYEPENPFAKTFS
jgi:hypothetical protein